MNEINCYSLFNSEYIYPGIIWNDTDGKSIETHTVGIIHDHDVNGYHSKDLLNWTNIKSKRYFC